MILIDAVTDWYCPNCPLTERTYEPRAHTRFHICPNLRGLTAPMLPVGTKAKVTAHDREDYIGNEIVPLDGNGRPIMSVKTTRDNGEDAIVFASTATMRV